MNMKTGSRIIAGVTIAAFLMVSAACQQANGTDTTKPSADQKAVNAEAAKITGSVLSGLQSGITGVTVTDAATAVELAESVANITLPALPSGLAEGVSAEWVSSDSAITLASSAGGVGQATVTHPASGEAAKTVTITIKFTKNGKHSEVAVAKFTVQPQAPVQADQDVVNAEAAKITGSVLSGLQSGITGATVTDAATAVELAESVANITLPALPSGLAEGVSAEWVSSDSAITLASSAGGVGQATVTHPASGEAAKTVTITIKFTKNGKHSEVAVAKFTVQPQS